MTRWRIKLVPDATPNADGRWLDVTKDHAMTEYAISRWMDAVRFFASDTPRGEHIISYERVND